MLHVTTLHTIHTKVQILLFIGFLKMKVKKLFEQNISQQLNYQNTNQISKKSTVYPFQSKAFGLTTQS